MYVRVWLLNKLWVF